MVSVEITALLPNDNFLAILFWVSFSSMKIVHIVHNSTYENISCFWIIVVSMKVQELLEVWFCQLQTWSVIWIYSRLPQMLQLKLLLLFSLSYFWCTIKHLLKGSFIILSACFIIAFDPFYYYIWKQWITFGD